MAVREVKPKVYWVGAIDWDRRIFDELIPLPDGTSYNAYLIIGSEKVALIDTVDPTKVDDLLKLQELRGLTTSLPIMPSKTIRAPSLMCSKFILTRKW